MALAVQNASPRASLRASPRHAGAAASVALHALALAVLLPQLPLRRATVDGMAISVELLTAPEAVAPQHPVQRAQQSLPRRLQPAMPASRPDPGPSAPAVLAAPPSPASVATAGEPTTAPKAAPAMPASTGSPAPSATSSAASVHAATPAQAPSLPVSQPVFNAAYLDNPAPAYPALSRRAGEQGRVLLRVLVNAAGRADEVQVRGSSGSTRLDEAACDTVRRWRFEPARRGEQAVPAWVLIPVSFSLGG